MELLAHRGLWTEKSEANSWEALMGALAAGFGVETDIRDLDGELVISHDPPRTGSALPLEKLLKAYAEAGYDSTLALNIKSDGLQEMLWRQLTLYGIQKYFVFDMSIPDTIGYLKLGMSVFLRRSELEEYSCLAAQAQGTWLDELSTPWITEAAVIETARQTRQLCVVSPELHGRAPENQWAMLKGLFPQLDSQLLLCTDFPRQAIAYFQ